MIEILFLAILVPFIIYICTYIISTKYRSVDNKKVLSGFEVAKKILDKNDIDVYIVECKNINYNVYDNDTKSIKFSKKDFHGEDLASLAFATIESIHVIQYHNGNKLIKFRNALMKTMELLCYFAYVVLLYGILVNTYNIILFSLVIFFIILLFHLFTYSIEKEAKEIAIEELLKNKLIVNSEKEDVIKLLNAYSLNYFASIITCLFKLISF